MATKRASCYLVLGQDHWRNPIVTGMRKSKPRLESGEIAVRVVLEVPEELFNELIPTVAVAIDPAHLEVQTIEAREDGLTGVGFQPDAGEQLGVPELDGLEDGR